MHAYIYDEDKSAYIPNVYRNICDTYKRLHDVHGYMYIGVHPHPTLNGARSLSTMERRCRRVRAQLRTSGTEALKQDRGFRPGLLIVTKWLILRPEGG